MRRVFLILLGAIVLLDAVAWVSAVTPRPPLAAPPIRPAVGVSAITEFDYCSSEEDIYAPVCDGTTNCEVDVYTCQLSPRTGWYLWRHVGFCGTCGAPRAGLREGAATPATMQATAGTPQSNLVPSSQTLDVASVSPAGAPALGGSLAPVLSGDGRFIAFDSAASNLVAGDANGKRDVFVRDRLLAQTTRVSVSSGGAEGTGHSIAPVITPDGRYVAFLSQAPNLVASDTNGLGDVFVHDRATAQTERVSLQPGNLQAARASWPDEDGGLDSYEGFIARSEELAISDDGRFVTFVTETAAGTFAISLRDRTAGTTAIITPQQPLASAIVSSSVGNPTVIATAAPHGLATGDAVEIAGHSAERACGSGVCGINTVPGHYCGFFFSEALLIPQTVTVLSATTFSVPLNVTQAGTGGSVTRVQDVRLTARPRVSISGDGGLIAFDWLYQIVTADTFRTGSRNGGRCFTSGDQRDVYLFDRQSGTTTLVSADASGKSANGYSGWPSISADGRYVTFASEASNLVPGDNDGLRNIFIRDRHAGTTTRVASDGHAVTPSISRDGRRIAFATVFRAGPARAFVYLYDRASHVTEFVNRSGEAFGLDGPSIGPSLSGDGSTIAFASAASNVATGDTNGLDDVFVGTFTAPVITTHPANVASVVVGGPAARYTVTATGFPAPRYRWQVSTDSGASWSDAAATIASRIPHGAANPDLYVFATTAMNGYRFRAIVSSSAGTATSNSAALSLCQYAITPPAAAIGASGGTGSFTVTTEAGCTWTPVSQDPFVALTSNFTRSGTWPIHYSVAAYSGVPRVGRVVVADQTFTLTQAGADPTMTLDRTVLHFAGSDGGSDFIYKTANQTVRLLQNGPGAVSWKASASAPWLTVSPTEGTGSATLSIGARLGGGLPASGIANGAVTLTLTGAGNSVGPITVTFNRLRQGSGAPPFGQFDTPLDGTAGVTGSIAVTGWALDDIEIRGVRILRNPVAGEGTALVFLGNAVFVDGARTDVQKEYGSMPLNSRAGWGYLLLTNFLPNLGNGTFTLYAFADDADGHSTLIGSTTITCSNASAVTPFGAIDTPAQGETVSGSVNNFGWVLAPGLRRADPPGGGTVRVLIDGAFLPQVPGGWTSRPDLSRLFPLAGFSGIDTALGVATLDTTTLANGVHTIAWLVTDNSNPPEAAGVGSRYFTVANGASGAAVTGFRSDALLAPPAAPGIDRLPALRTVRVGRQGFNVAAAYRTYPADGEGRIIIRSEEMDRLELREVEPDDRDVTITGYLRVPTGLAPLPIGSSLSNANGAFTWNPGVGFVGTYDLVFVGWRKHLPVWRQEVRIILQPQGAARVGAQVAIDVPAAPAVFAAGEPIVVAGWAADLDSLGGRGVDTVHVWAYPVRTAMESPGTPDPIFLGAASYGGPRPDVASTYGERFRETGYGIVIDSLSPGMYDVAVFAYSTVMNAFAPARTVRVTIR